MLSSTTCGSEPPQPLTMRASPDPSSLLGFGYSKISLPLLRRYTPPPPPETNPFLSAGHSPHLKTYSPSPTRLFRRSNNPFSALPYPTSTHLRPSPSPAPPAPMRCPSKLMTPPIQRG